MSLTDKVITLVVLVLLAYEGWTLSNATTGDTISESFWRWSAGRPLVPFLMGFLMGHFFWQAGPK